MTAQPLPTRHVSSHGADDHLVSRTRTRCRAANGAERILMRAYWPGAAGLLLVRVIDLGGTGDRLAIATCGAPTLEST